MQKKPKRELKYKNIFEDGQQPQDTAQQVVETVAPPPPPPKFAQFVQQKQSPIENRVVEEASRVAPPVAIQPVQVASVQPTVVVETAVKTVTPKQPTPESLQHNDVHVTPILTSKPAIESKPPVVAVIEPPKVDSGAPDKKRSKIEELKSKYLKKTDPRPPQEPSPVILTPTMAPSIEPTRQAPPPPPKIFPPPKMEQPVIDPIEPAPSQVFQQFRSTTNSPPIPEKPSPAQQHVESPTSFFQAVPVNIMDYFKQDALSPASPPLQPEILHKQSSDSLGGDASAQLQIQTELNSPFHRPFSTAPAKPPPPPPSVHRKPRKELGVYREPQSEKEKRQQALAENPSQDSIERVSLFTNASINQQPPDLRQSKSEVAPDSGPSQLPVIQRIKHTLSIAQSPVNSPMHREDLGMSFVPEVVEPFNENVNPLDLINNFPKLAEDIKRDKLIDEQCYQVIRNTISLKSAADQISDNRAVEPRTDSKIHFDFPDQANGLSPEELSSQWLRSFFETFILYAKEIEPESEAFSYHFITSVFNSTDLNSAFIISLLKTSKRHYSNHEEELMKNILHCIRCMKAHRHWISEPKVAEFIGFAIERLRNYYSGDHYCRIFIEIAYSFPSTVLSNDEFIACFFRECQRFGYNSLLFWLVSVNAKITTLKNISVTLSNSIREFEEKGLNEQCLTLLDGVGAKMGTQAYPILRELRSRVVSKISTIQEQSSRRSGKGGVFGGILNQAFNFINNPIRTTPPPPTKDDVGLPEEKEDIYYDPEKKRYVLKGEIPEDEEQERQKSKQNAPPPPPPPRHLSQPNSPPQVTYSSPDQPQVLDRAVGIPPPPPPRRGATRIPPNRYVTS